MAVEALLSALSLGQNAFTHANDLRWREIDLFVEQRQLRVDVLHNCREDVQDLFERDERSLDTSLVVVTLLLVVAFGFMVEGTFPKDTGPSNMRVVYAVVAGLSLVCPLWAMLGFFECRRRTLFFMRAFNKHFRTVVSNENNRFSQLAAKSHDMSQVVNESVDCLPTPTPRKLSEVVARLTCRRRARPSIARQRTNSAWARMEYCLMVRQEYAVWWKRWCDRWYTASTVFLYLGIFFNVLLSALLLGLYFVHHFPDTPWVPWIYAIIVLLGLTFAGVALVFFWWRGPHRELALFRRSRARVLQDVRVPRWMVQNRMAEPLMPAVSTP